MVIPISSNPYKSYNNPETEGPITPPKYPQSNIILDAILEAFD